MTTLYSEIQELENLMLSGKVLGKVKRWCPEVTARSFTHKADAYFDWLNDQGKPVTRSLLSFLDFNSVAEWGRSGNESAAKVITETLFCERGFIQSYSTQVVPGCDNKAAAKVGLMIHRLLRGVDKPQAISECFYSDLVLFADHMSMAGKWSLDSNAIRLFIDAVIEPVDWIRSNGLDDGLFGLFVPEQVDAFLKSEAANAKGWQTDSTVGSLARHAILKMLKEIRHFEKHSRFENKTSWNEAVEKLRSILRRTKDQEAKSVAFANLPEPLNSQLLRYVEHRLKFPLPRWSRDGRYIKKGSQRERIVRLCGDNFTLLLDKIDLNDQQPSIPQVLNFHTLLNELASGGKSALWLIDTFYHMATTTFLTKNRSLVWPSASDSEWNNWITYTKIVCTLYRNRSKGVVISLAGMDQGLRDDLLSFFKFNTTRKHKIKGNGIHRALPPWKSERSLQASVAQVIPAMALYFNWLKLQLGDEHQCRLLDLTNPAMIRRYVKQGMDDRKSRKMHAENFRYIFTLSSQLIATGGYIEHNRYFGLGRLHFEEAEIELVKVAIAAGIPVHKVSPHRTFGATIEAQLSQLRVYHEDKTQPSWKWKRTKSAYISIQERALRNAIAPYVTFYSAQTMRRPDDFGLECLLDLDLMDKYLSLYPDKKLAANIRSLVNSHDVFRRMELIEDHELIAVQLGKLMVSFQRGMRKTNTPR